MSIGAFKETRSENFAPAVEKSEFDPDKRIDVNDAKDAKAEASYNPDKRIEVKDESGDVKNLKTINEDLEGKEHPETGVPYVKKTVEVDGQKVEGVFPEFDSKCDLKLPAEMYKATDTEQFKYCTEKLAEKIKSDPEFAKQFTSRQIAQIEEGSPRISGLTWHHSETPGKMQLVDADKHAGSGHTGGRSIWGGGSDNR